MSTIDTSTWSPDSSLNTDIGGIPLNADASIQQTWQAIQMLMAALKGDTAEIKLTINQPDGTTIVATNQTLSVVDNSHAHTIANVTGLQTALDGKAADSDVVHLTGNETVSGEKSINGVAITASGDIQKTSDSGHVYLCGGAGTAHTRGAKIVLRGSGDTTDTGCFGLSAGINNSTKCWLVGTPQGSLTWGGQGIQISSDERLKTPLAVIPDAVLDAWEGVQWGQFQFLSAVDCKGEAARLHLGLIAQRVKAVFESHGLDACEYGILCHEERDATDEEPAIDLWMVRYEEALALEAAFQRRRADRLEARIAALEEMLNG